MITTGDNVVAAMLNAWHAVHPIRRASIRWRCEVRVHQQGMRTVVAHKPGVMVQIRRNTEGGAA
jgi:hypothetical protein